MDQRDTSSHSSVTLMLWPFYAALAVFSVLALYGLVKGYGIDSYKAESGPFEVGALVAMGLALVAYVLKAPDMAFGRGWHVTVVLLLLMARELDFDKRFTEKGVLQARLYSGDYSLTQKLIGAAVICLILITLYRCVRVGAKPFLRGLRKGMAWAWWLAGSCVLVVIAKSLDGLGRKLAPYGIEISTETDTVAALVEEGFELLFAMGLILAVSTWVHARDTRNLR